LRRSVERLSTCLDELPTAQRRVLVLRTGLGSADPRTRRGVARKLDIGVRRVARLERTGLRRARALDRTGACGSASSGGGAIVSPGSLGGGAGGGEATPVVDSAGGGTPGGGDRGGAGDGSSGSGAGSGDVRGESQTQPPPALGGPHDSPEGTSLWVAAGLMLLAALAGFAVPGLRDRVRGGATTSSRAG
jgi:hypothetical protein